jgi:hypothetical protein
MRYPPVVQTGMGGFELIAVGGEVGVDHVQGVGEVGGVGVDKVVDVVVGTVMVSLSDCFACLS